MTDTATDVVWPWQYSFPPFFTIQTHADTRSRQLEAWRSLVLQYQRTNQQCVLDVREAQQSPLFHNSAIRRTLPVEGIQTILEDLARTGNAESIDKSKMRWYIYWRTLEEWAKLIYSWAVNSGSTNSVCTLYELTKGDNTLGEEFYGLDQDVLLKALKILETENKAELMIFGDNQGVKFF